MGGDPDRQVERVARRRLGLVEPPAREVERVAGAEHEVVRRVAVLAECRRVALVLERQLEQRLVEEPALLARDLEHEHVVRVVVHGEALRAARRVVRVRLHGVAERLLEQAAEDGERVPAHVERLEDDRRPGLPLGEDARDVHGARERRAPGDVAAVLADGELPAFADEPEGRIPDRGGADEPLDVRFREQVVEAAALVSRHDERALLPVLVEERRGVDRVETARERRLGRSTRRRVVASASASSASASAESESSASPSVVSVSSPSASAVGSSFAARRDGLDLVVVQGRHRFLLVGSVGLTLHPRPASVSVEGMSAVEVRRYGVQARSTDTFGRVLWSCRDQHFVADGPVHNGAPARR